MPENFGQKQFNDFDYKTENGESLNDVLNRELIVLNELLNNYNDSQILVVGHSTALAALFSKWCKVQYTGEYKFNGKEFFDGKLNYCETFKLTFDDNNNLANINIENIK